MSVWDDIKQEKTTMSVWDKAKSPSSIPIATVPTIGPAPKPSVWDKVKQTFWPETAYAKLPRAYDLPTGRKYVASTEVEPQAYLQKALNLPTQFLTGLFGGMTLGADKLLWHGLGKKLSGKSYEDTLKELSVLEQGYAGEVKDVARFAGEISSAGKILKTTGLKAPTGKKFLDRVARNAPPWMTSGAINGLVEGITEDKNIGGAAKEAIKGAALRGIGAVAASGLEWAGGKLLSRIKKGLQPPKPRIRISATGKPKYKVPLDIKEIRDPAEKLNKWIRRAKFHRKGQEQLRAAERSVRAGKLSSVFEKGKGWETYKKALGTQKGELPRIEIKPPEGSEMTPVDLEILANRVIKSDKLLSYQKLNSLEGLHQLLFEGRIPPNYNLQQLEKVFGKPFAKAILSKRTLGGKAYNALVDIANFPRAVLASYDISHSLRQSLLKIRHPILWKRAFKMQLKALVSEKNGRAIDQAIRHSKWFPLAEKSGLYLPDIYTETGALAARPEEFMSRFAEKYVPGVRVSERAFVTMGNKLRMDLFSKYAERWAANGITSKTNPDYFAKLTKLLNASTGRGNLPIFLKKYGAELNATFFSPRYVLGRLQSLYYPFAKNVPWEVRKIAIADLATFLSTQTGLLAFMDYAGGDKVDIEWNPRSSDFAKIRIGDFRIDTLGGFQQLVRYATQAATEEVKNANTGKIRKTDWLKVLGRFTRSKLSPGAAFLVDLKTGETFVGDEMSFEKTAVAEQVWQRFVPLPIQETMEAFAHEGIGAGLMALPCAELGINTSAWEPTKWQQMSMFQDEKAVSAYGKQWDDLTEAQQFYLKQYYPQMEQYKKAAQAAGQTFPFVEEMLQEQQQTGQLIAGKLPPNIQHDMKKLNVRMGGIARTIGDNHYLNDKRYEVYQNIIAQNMNIILGRIVSGRKYKESPDTAKQAVLEAAIKEVKKQSRIQYRQWEHGTDRP